MQKIFEKYVNFNETVLTRMKCYEKYERIYIYIYIYIYIFVYCNLLRCITGKFGWCDAVRIVIIVPVTLAKQNCDITFEYTGKKVIYLTPRITLHSNIFPSRQTAQHSPLFQFAMSWSPRILG